MDTTKFEIGSYLKKILLRLSRKRSGKKHLSGEAVRKIKCRVYMDGLQTFITTDEKVTKGV